MNFLQIANACALNCGIAGTFTTIANQVGSLGRIVAWINDAWTDIQMDHDDWDWMRASQILGSGISFQTIAGQASYPLGTGAGTVGVLPDNFTKWVQGEFFNYTTSVGPINEIPMTDRDFDYWRNVYAYGANRNIRTRPFVVAVGPDKSLCLGPYPNDQYTVTGDYYVGPTQMVADTDVPVGLPTRFAMLICYRVMMKYGGYESAQEVYARGMEENAGMYAQLQRLYAPRISFTGALA